MPRIIPVRPANSNWGGCWSLSFRPKGSATPDKIEHGIVLATVPATAAGAAPTIALCSHLDTSPETTGAGVKPQVIEDYSGGDIALPGDPGRVIRTADNPELSSFRGRTLITSDGTTLLGADDKAGVAVIMETAARLVEHPEIPHGAVRILLHLRRGTRSRRGEARRWTRSRRWRAIRSMATAAARSTSRPFQPTRRS